MKIKNLEWKKIAILGFGKEWKSSLDFLINQWIDFENITIFDQNNQEIDNWVKWFWGNENLNKLDNTDVIIKSPGISPYNEQLSKYKDKITSQAQIFFDNYKDKVILVSGTKGKSTTASLIYETIKNAGYKTKLVWNIGNPVLSEINFKEKYDFIVFEISSYMLDGLEKKNYISVLLNIYPDHLTWHQWFDHYKDAKLNILNWAQKCLISNQVYNNFPESHKYNVQIFGENWYYHYDKKNFYIGDKIIFDDKEIKLIGNHNKSNICAVLWVCDMIWIDFDILKNTLKKFKWLSHRLENIWTYRWITFFDDGISTTPQSTIFALHSLWSKIWTIMLWWQDRWYDFTQLVMELKNYNIRNIILFPDTGPKIKELLDRDFNTLETKSMEEAVKFAYKKTAKWKICLLSPASPSYSIWKNFEEKWAEYKYYIQKLS